MKVADLRVLTRECNLQDHSRLQKAALIALLQKNETVQAAVPTPVTVSIAIPDS